MVAPPDTPVLLDHLASVLGEPRVVFAGTEKGGSGFVTPVLQLFTPDGTLDRLRQDRLGPGDDRHDPRPRPTASSSRVGPGGISIRVPEVRWRGAVAGPRAARHRADATARAPPPRSPSCHRSSRCSTSPCSTARSYATRSLRRPTGTDALATAVDRARRPVATSSPDHLDAVARDYADAELTFGRWHGDWVEWNLARGRTDELWVWDWAYSAPGVPFGFDLVQFFHLRHRVLREEPGRGRVAARGRARRSPASAGSASRGRTTRGDRAAPRRGAAPRGAGAPSPRRGGTAMSAAERSRAFSRSTSGAWAERPGPQGQERTR